MKSQEKDLQKQISTRKKRDQQLKSAIAAVVRREIEAARKAAAEKAAAERAAKAKETSTENPTASVTAPKKRLLQAVVQKAIST